MGANFGIAGMDWQQRVNWDRLREYRIERARQMMKKHGLGALLCMYDENCRYITGTLTPGWNRLKPGLRYAMLCGDGRRYCSSRATSVSKSSGMFPGCRRRTFGIPLPGSKALPVRLRPSR